MATFVLIVMLLSLAASLYFTIRSAVVKIPAAHYGLVLTFSKRTGRKLREGLQWKIPFFQSVDIFLAKIVTLSLYEKDGEVARVSSKDNIQIIIECSLEIIPSFKKLYEFSGVSKDTILKGLKDSIEENLGIIAGQEEGQSFISKKESIGLLLNSLFRLPRRFDYYLNPKEIHMGMSTTAYKDYYKTLEDKFPKERLKIKEKLHWDSDWEILSPDPKDTNNKIWNVLDFYKQNITKIEYILELESKIDNSSNVENLYGIEIKKFSMPRVDFSKEYKEALEAEKTEENRMKGVMKVHEVKMKIKNELQGGDITESEALAEASAAVGDSERKTNKVSGGSTVNLNNL